MPLSVSPFLTVCVITAPDSARGAVVVGVVARSGLAPGSGGAGISRGLAGSRVGVAFGCATGFSTLDGPGSLTVARYCIRVALIAGKRFFNNERRRFVASFLGNVGVLLLSAGALSESFIALSNFVKVSIVVLGLACFVGGIIVSPEESLESKED